MDTHPHPTLQVSYDVFSLSQKSLPLTMLVPQRMIAIALHVMLGTAMRTNSWFVCVDQIRISSLEHVRIKSELLLKLNTQASQNL